MWQPREDYWNYIRGLLESSVGISSIKTDHSTVSKTIEEFSKLPDSAHYYAFIFVFDEQSSEPARGLAGLLFKNKLRASVDSLDEAEVAELLKLIQQPLLNLLARPSFLQRTVGSILSTLITDCNGLKIWPSLLEDLLKLPRNSLVFAAIDRICEDAAFELVEHAQIFNPFLQNILLILASDPKELKMHLISIVGHLIPTHSELLTRNVDSLINCFVVDDPAASSELKVTSCRVLSVLLEFYWTLLTEQQVKTIFDYILKLYIESESDSDRDLLKQCAEFWLSQVQSEAAVDLFRGISEPFLAQLIPLLMDRCAYDEEEDEDELCKAMEDLSVPDDAEEFKPRHRKAEHFDDCDECEEDNEDIVTSLRKCSAATLDGLSLSLVNPKTFLTIFLPAFNDRVNSTDWKIREAALLAFGAVVEGLWQNLTSHLAQIVPFLLANARTHPHPLVRSMSLWSLSRTVAWLTEPADFDVEYGNPLLSESLQILIGSLGDANKRVQQSAVTALCRFLEEAGRALTISDRKSLISAIFLAIKCYQHRSCLILYELIRIFGQVQYNENVLSFDAESFQYWRSIADTLVQRFGPQSLNDSSLFPIIEALMSLLALDSNGNLLEPARREEMNFKALSLAAQNLSVLKEAKNEEGYCADSIQSEGLDDFLIAALDLLAAATESSKLFPSPQLHSLLKNVLAASLNFKDSSNVRQSAFALFGDYIVVNSSFFDPKFIQDFYFPAIKLNILPSSLDDSANRSYPVSMATATNAVWSLGELALHSKSPIPSEISGILHQILKNRQNLETGARIYFENVAVCIGRIFCTSEIVFLIDSDTFLNRILNLLTTVESEEERSTALSGYTRILRSDPQLSLRNYQIFIYKLNELIDFTEGSPYLTPFLTSFKHPQTDPSFYSHLQPLLRQMILH